MHQVPEVFTLLEGSDFEDFIVSLALLASRIICCLEAESLAAELSLLASATLDR